LSIDHVGCGSGLARLSLSKANRDGLGLRSVDNRGYKPLPPTINLSRNFLSFL